VSTNIKAISISSDSHYAAIGCSSGNYSVAILDLKKRDIVQTFSNLHTCKNYDYSSQCGVHQD